MDDTRLGVDVGGTFTDVVAVRDGRVTVEKVASTPDAPEEGVLAGVDASDADPEAVTYFGHGTTHATNAVLERDWAETALVTTEGFRDALEIGRQARPDLYDLHQEKPRPVVERDRRYEVPERLDERGEVLDPLDESAVRDLADRIDADGVAVALLFAYENPAHERRVRDLLAAELDAHVSVSSEVLPEIREYERTLTTALNAALAPPVGRYVGRLDDGLRERGVTAPLRVMGSNGGVMTAREARERPVTTLLSGPAAGVQGAAHVAERAGLADLVTMDMGGTSCDVSLVRDGDPVVATDVTVGDYPVGVPTVDVHTVGAGGGSIASLDAGDALQVGPESAGADPGPACYGRGGTRPTVTDAHAVLGRIDPGAFLPEGDATLAREAFEPLAGALGEGIEDAAAGVLRVANANMAGALRVVTVERGHDPREFGLVAFGGAGPLHAAALAEEVGMREVLVPRTAGVLSALGLLVSDVVADESASRVRPWSDVDPDALGETFADLEADARERLGDGDGEVRVDHTVDVRYVGQSFDVRVPADDIAAVPERFHERHERRYGYAAPDESLELVTVRVRARRVVDPPDIAPVDPGSTLADARRETRDVRFDDRTHDAAVYDREALPTGTAFDGPAIVEGAESTVVVRPDDAARVDADGNIRLEVSA
ncbi:hydantoinase/oxoprolinase family protein [Halorarius halobius]|uniref:hydantoinase/oxoprolinase family protein n=1 Tax=Halorarius halobius TaxID=2962671 RepID=UPI0020CF9BCB|nr:hydantoinase/oxoprolinase family protein [Halorarius halobius]